jgi:hypothetical protein
LFTAQQEALAAQKAIDNAEEAKKRVADAKAALIESIMTLNSQSNLAKEKAANATANQKSFAQATESQKKSALAAEKESQDQIAKNKAEYATHIAGQEKVMES